MEQHVIDFLKKHGLSDEWGRGLGLVNVPGGPQYNEDTGELLPAGEGYQSEFYLKLNLGTKHFVEASSEKELVAWLKLTEKLFLRS
ncbi:hypothetical protein LCGC14_0478420 [marine sediment metagenome]|uniref:Uncharacterized protein n=1 Tax=marine sediment metagenome TaxID=412755 RepID=A0A0F9VIN6_9ZZZZ